MDIYQKILAELAVEQLSFDENQVCCFKVHSAASPEGSPYVVNIVGNTVLQELALSVTTTVSIPSQVPKSLFSLFAEYAMGPLRGDPGIGVFAGTEQASVFTTISLADYRSGLIQETLAELLEKAHEWDELLLDNEATGQEQEITPATQSFSSSNIRV
ncbi:hypothetical protein [Vibrio sagamiensis]|uniref:Type III secretion system chaperone n=1 Tax=Vibrio sagamiensis NBRC 104589 TaxID=1219064 RepID=A0A511QDY9_9VIBR|nr:hypothetical protein [Vibrio sagamiensis]PNQ53865.1 hypothetical protein C1141_18970 [Vibrio agarivorans]GEM75518.1 hypothetical protein VSA01S_16300 [Vibrio sagamiensis NBRC 104589]